MTATQAPPVTSPSAAPASTAAQPTPGLARLLSSADHKVIGRLYVGTALLFGLASAVTGVLAGLERIDGAPGDIVESNVIGQVTSFHALGGVLLFLIPALLGLALVVVPLQVGARSVAFPRAAAASYWTYLLGGSLVAASYATNGGPGGGSADGVDLWAVSTSVVCAAIVLGSLCVATTILSVRAKGMRLDRVPMFTWAMLCTTVVWLLTLPVLVATLIIIYVDHRHGQVFLGGAGPDMADTVAWFGVAPQVYALAIPLLGLALDAATTASGRRLQQRGAARGAISLFAILSVGAFALPGIVAGATDQPVTKGMLVLAPLPVLAVLALIGLTLKGGSLTPTSGLVGSVVGVLVLLLATVVGAASAFEGALEVAGTQFITGHSHLVIVASALGLIAGLYHWATKIIGRAGSEALGRTAPLLLGLGALVLAVPELISGLTGDTDPTFPGELSEAQVGVESLNMVAVAGAALVVLGAALAIVGLVGRRRDEEPADPWGGQTLEWATASPPGFGNFDGEVPAVTSAEPLLAADTEEASV